MTRMGEERVVITGIGGVTPIGIGADAMWESATAGRSGIGPITIWDASGVVYDNQPGAPDDAWPVNGFYEGKIKIMPKHRNCAQ